tara:strand:+ start:359 stop:1000 length:642 start_codon:yes stop_codon:yes gene_type:complete
MEIIKNSIMEEELFYGNLSFSLKEQSNEINLEIEPLYNKFIDSIYIFPDIYKSSLEIDYLIKNLATNLDDSHIYIIIDKDLKSFLKNSSIEKGVSSKEYDSIEKTMAKFEPLILKLKEYWNRARPYQYANLIEAPLYPINTVSGHSPAYPSGHTLQGLVWARLISVVKPELKEWADSMAVKINLSRLALGVHFPSDIDFSKKICKYLIARKFI